MPVLGAQTHQEAGQGEGGGADSQEDSPGQLGVQEVGQDRQQDGREDEDENEGRACQKLKYGKLFISICICVLAPRKPKSKYKFCI